MKASYFSVVVGVGQQSANSVPAVCPGLGVFALPSFFGAVRLHETRTLGQENLSILVAGLFVL